MDKRSKLGFTLIELLAVIIILAIILAIAIPNISKIIKNTTKVAFEIDVNMVLKKLESKKIEDRNFDITTVTEETITSLKLSNINYETLQVSLADDNPYILIVGTGKWEGLKACGTIKNVQVVDKNNIEKCIIPPIYTDFDPDGGVNKPKLAKGMTAIKWDGNDWIKVDNPDADASWYDYANKEWANAVTSDCTTPEDYDTCSMWVWIPRYAYQIATCYHRDGNQCNTATGQRAGTINIKFLIDTTNTAIDETPIAEVPDYNLTEYHQENFIKHPAFTFGSGEGSVELTGMWVSKFEMSGATSALDSKPNVTSLRGVTVGNMFDETRNMEKRNRYGWDQESGILNDDGTFSTNTNNVDVHMMKNIEWGAVAYLSKSIYGKNTEEIFVNPSGSYITGRGGQTVSQLQTTDATDSSSETLYGYDGKSCSSKTGYVCTGEVHATYGRASSTTGNTYGIYDMSGSAEEAVMGNYDNREGGSEIEDVSFLNNKYIDRYSTTDSGYTASNYGDAVYETSGSSSAGGYSWYNDGTVIITTSYPWFIRGGHRNYGTSSGAFRYGNYYGVMDIGKSWRSVVLVGTGL